MPIVEKAVPSDEEVGQLREVFEIFDSEDSGKIPVDLAVQLCRASGQNPTQAEMDIICTQLGGIGAHFDEQRWLDVMSNNWLRYDLAALAKEAFEVIDADNSGFIDAAELRHVMTNLGDRMSEAEVDRLMAKVDRSGDKLIDFEEFQALILGKLE